MNHSNLKQSLLFLTIFTAGMILLNMKNSSSTDEFSEWKTFHNIEYKGEFENSYRRRVFYENKLKMIEHSANP